MKLNIGYKDDYKIYNIYFSDLADLYYYLKSNPKINSDIFHKIESEEGDYKFAGDNYKKSIEYIVNGYPYNFDNFLVANERLQSGTIDISDSRELKRGIYGGVPLAPLVAAEVPDCMLRYDRTKECTTRNMYFSLGYPWHNKQEQIFNRGVSTLYIIDKQEKKGDVVNFIARETSECGNEIVNIEIVLKKPTDLMLDIKKCYYPIVGREFLRRLLFRVLECTPVHSYWSDGYGRQLEEDELRKMFDLKDTDYVISTPNEIGISGNDIYKDTIRLIDNLNLKEEFDIQKIKRLTR